MASDSPNSSSKLWTVFSLASSLGAAAVTKKLLDRAWRIATGRRPPENPADPDVEIWEAVSWAVASGTAVGIARMLAQRRAASYYARSTGHLPPELRKDHQRA
jgi:hypothetical protein